MNWVKFFGVVGAGNFPPLCRTFQRVSLPQKEPDWGLENGQDLSKLSEEAKKLNGEIKNTRLDQLTSAEWELGGELYRQATNAKNLTARACDMLMLLKGEHMKVGFPVDMYTHSLQTATRAHRAGATDEIVVVALLHDVGELMSPVNHGDVAAGILRPYISRKAHWALANHEVFQGYYYFHHYGMDRNRREQLRGAGGSGSGLAEANIAGSAPDGAWELCQQFCQEFDMPSFDPDYQNMQLEYDIPPH